jgi:hypothetical protein
MIVDPLCILTAFLAECSIVAAREYLHWRDTIDDEDLNVMKGSL